MKKKVFLKPTEFWVTLIAPFTKDEVIRVTTQLKTNKASVQDFIKSEMIKASLDSSLSFLVNLFKKILVTQNYPENWRSDIITLMLTSGEVRNADYRGITINSCLSKHFNLFQNNYIGAICKWPENLKIQPSRI